MQITHVNISRPSITVDPRPAGDATYTMIGVLPLDKYMRMLHLGFRLGVLGIFGHSTVLAILLIGELVTGTGVLFMLGIPSLVILLQIAVQKQWKAIIARQKMKRDKHRVIAAIMADHKRSEEEQQSDPYLAATAEWHEYVTIHDQIKEKIWTAETDWDTIFYYPAINDHMVPETQDLIMAYTVAQSTSAVLPKQLSANTMIADLPYPKAVLALQKAWNIAWANAQKIAQSNLTDAERKDIKQIITLLRKVEDGAATESEKIVAYDRIDVLMRNLRNITIPERKKTILAAERRQALTTGTTDDMQDAPQDGSERREREAQDASTR